MGDVSGFAGNNYSSFRASLELAVLGHVGAEMNPGTDMKLASREK